jgi:hypothetical protein
MSYIDMAIKWFKTPKTQRGIAGMAVIIIVLAIDFAWWAGNIEVTAATTIIGSGDDEVVEGDNWTYGIDIDETMTGTLLIPSGGIFKSEGLSTASYEFEVNENAALGFVNVSVTSNKARPDFDLVVYGPDGDSIGESKTEEANEHIEIDERVFNRTGPGTYVAEVDNYSSFFISYELTIQIYVKVPIEEDDEGNP